MRLFGLKSLRATPRRYFLGFVVELWQTLLEEDRHQSEAVFEFFLGQLPALGDVMPIGQTRATATCGCMLCVEDCIAVERCLKPIPGRRSRCQIPFKAGSCRLYEARATLAARMAHC